MDDRKPEVPGGESLPPEDGIQAKARRARSMFEPSSLMPKGLLPEDLPYAAEVQASLARRPERGSRMLSLGTLLFFVVLFIWASIATLDEVTHADGQVIPSSRTQIIENLEGGILAEVFVHEGQIVEKGDILARIDNESAESSLRDAMNKAMENCAAIIRLRTIITSRDMLVWPEDMAGAVQKACGQMPTKQQMDQLENTQRMQEQIFEVQLRQRNAELDVLRDQVRQRTQELDQRQARLDHLKKTRGLIREQVALAAPLVSKGSYSRARYLSMEERSARIQSEIATLEASLPRAETAAEEARHRLELRRAEMDAELVNEANRRTLELGTQREILSAGLDRVTRTELRSPVRGTVNKIYLNTLGGVVKPGSPVMELVPLDDTLLVEARVKPQDVAFLYPGLPVTVRITAYDFAIYGGLKGTLEHVSADTVEDGDGSPCYLVKVRTDQTSITHKDKVLPIIPGMTVTADIMTGSRTVLDYLMKPIFKAGHNALGEK